MMNLKGTMRKPMLTVESVPIEQIIKQSKTKLKVEKPIYKTYEDYPIEDLLSYAGIDCIVTSELLTRLSKRITEEPTYTWVEKEGLKFVKSQRKMMSIQDSYKKYTSEAFDFIMDLEVNGILYDVEGNRLMKARLETEIAELEAVIRQHIGNTFSIDSGQQMAHYLFTERGFEVTRRTKTGEPSTDGEAIKDLGKRYPAEKVWMDPLAKRNDLVSIYRTFIETYVEDFVKKDGRVHASYSLHGTGSFRIAGDSPNLTQLPRPKHNYNIRKLFTVAKGMTFMAFDFSSAEVKILGAICRDPELLKAIEQGLDFHAYSASKMYNLNYDEFVEILGDSNHPLYGEYKNKRQFSKALTFGILYGSSPSGISLALGITIEQAKELINLYFATFPLIKVYVDTTHEMAKINHLVYNPFGQRKAEYGAMKIFEGTAAYNGCLRNSQNVRVQGTTSSFGMSCFAELNKVIKPFGAKSLSSVYDSVELEVPLEHAAEVLELGFLYLNDYPVKRFDWLTLPVGVDAEIGLNWGDAGHIARGTTQTEIEVMYKGWTNA
jgi:DNA polymerase-1